jgi:DNA polymerase-1
MVKKNIYIVLAHKNNMIVDSKKVKEIFGVTPEQMVDYLAITGDPSDNIPGLPGFGPKTASSLLQKYHTLEEILKHPERLSGKKKEILIKEQGKAVLSKELTVLKKDVKIPTKKEFYLPKEPDIEKLSAFFREMKFSKFLKELKIPEKELPSKKIKGKEKKVSYTLIENEREMKKLISDLSKAKEICIDTETTSQHPTKAELIGIGFCTHPTKAFYIPLNSNIEEKVVIDSLKELFKRSNISFFGHNLKYDMHVLENYGILIKKISFDTILASYLLNPQQRRHNLDLLTLHHFDKVKISYKELTTKNKKNIPLKEVDVKKVSDYCCEDVDYTFRLKEVFLKELKEQNLYKLLFDIEIPLIPVLEKMERRGMYLDRAVFEKLHTKFSEELKKLESEIFKKTKEKFNINSPKQLSHVLFKKLNLPLPKRKKTEYSTGANVLEKLALKYPVVSLIIQHRTLQKLLSTYVIALPKEIDIKTNRIHPTFNQSITATGRLSCQDPNLQNIPVKSSDIRRGFKPKEKGWSYIGADYSQIELRILAHFSEDEELLKAFNNKEDIHAHTASLVFKVPIKGVTPRMRKIAKAVNFGILYGQGAFGLSQQLNISNKEASTIIDNYFKRYKRISSFIEKCILHVNQKKEVRTYFGRKRPIFEIDNKNPIVRAAAKRLAINTPLQGTAADIIKLAMIEIDKEIEKRKLKGFMILQIHDELIFEVPDNEIPTFKNLIEAKMEKVIKLKVPLIVDIRVGKNWSEC